MKKATKDGAELCDSRVCFPWWHEEILKYLLLVGLWPLQAIWPRCFVGDPFKVSWFTARKAWFAAFQQRFHILLYNFKLPILLLLFGHLPNCSWRTWSVFIMLKASQHKENPTSQAEHWHKLQFLTSPTQRRLSKQPPVAVPGTASFLEADLNMMFALCSLWFGSQILTLERYSEYDPMEVDFAYPGRSIKPGICHFILNYDILIT